jgi:hypothetical protein
MHSDSNDSNYSKVPMRAGARVPPIGIIGILEKFCL